MLQHGGAFGFTPVLKKFVNRVRSLIEYEPTVLYPQRKRKAFHQVRISDWYEIKTLPPEQQAHHFFNWARI